jgi:hypothetical protein
MEDLLKITEHPLFIAMRNGILNTREFLEKFVVFQRAIGEWNILLVKLLMRESSVEIRKILAQNLLDELNYGNPCGFRVYTFVEFIKFVNPEVSVAYDSNFILKRNRDFSGLINFIEFLQDLPDKNTYYVYSFIGNIEKMYAEISKEISSYTLKLLNMDNSEKVPHFSDHAILGQDHGNELLKIIDIESALAIKGKTHAKEIFWKLFNDFYVV